MTSHRPRVYISGPITGIPNFNSLAFIQADIELTNKCFIPVNPLKVNGVVKGNEVVMTAEEHSKKSREYYLRNDVDALVKCDYIYFLPGWENSKGALFEKSIAVELKIGELTKVTEGQDFIFLSV